MKDTKYVNKYMFFCVQQARWHSIDITVSTGGNFIPRVFARQAECSIYQII